MKSSLLGILFCLVITTVTAQEVYTSSGKTETQRKHEAARKRKDKGFDPSRLIYGGGLGLSIGSVTDISVAPIIGYRFNDNLSAGIGLGYEYLKAKNYNAVYDASGNQILKPLTAHIISPNLWGRYMFWRNVFVHAEYEQKFLSLTKYSNDPSTFPPPIVSTTQSYNEPALWLGAGLRQPISERVSFLIMALYDVLPDDLGLYNGRIDFRFGINAGF